VGDDRPTNGSWTGRDPALRRLRALAIGVLLVLIAWTVVDNREITTIGTLVGALLVALGFEVGIRWPRTGGDQ